MDKIEITPFIETVDYDECQYNLLKFNIFINDVKVDFYVDFFAFLFSKKNVLGWYDDVPQNERALFSGFEPFTCSCGCGGCAGVYQGISSKHRRYTVEWRIPFDAGYEKFLSKRFYRFNTSDYERQLAEVVRWMLDNADVVVYDDDLDGETTIWDIVSSRASSRDEDINDELIERWDWLRGLVAKYNV